MAGAVLGWRQTVAHDEMKMQNERTGKMRGQDLKKAAHRKTHRKNEWKRGLCLLGIVLMAGMAAGCGGNGAGNANANVSETSYDIDLVGKFVTNEEDAITFQEDGNYIHAYSVEESEPYIVFGKYEVKNGKIILYDIDLFDSGEKIVYAEGKAVSETEIRFSFLEMKREATYTKEEG